MTSSKTGPDNTQIMLQKNDRIRERHVKTIRRIGSEAQRSNGDLEKQIGDLQKEILDNRAYTTVYKDNSLIRIDQRRSKPSYNNFLGNMDSQPQHLSLPSTSAAPKKGKTKSSSAAPRLNDPFHVKNCLQDVDHDFEEKEIKAPPKPLHLVADDEPKMSTRKRLKRSSTAFTTRGSSEYQSLLPGNCTSYYSIRKFYEQEKDKLLQKWSPEERRRRTVRWILDNIRLPEFSEIRRSATSAIFRDFAKYKKSTSGATEPHVSLPAIEFETEQADRRGSSKARVKSSKR